jgi:hypothetical protein
LISWGMRWIRLAAALLIFTACKSAGSEGGETGSESGTETSVETETGTDSTPTSCVEDSCAVGEWCDWTLDTCVEDPQGYSECRPTPADCTDVPSRRVCGCDGTIYDSACDAELAGVDVNADASTCPPIPGTFVCGSTWCDVDVEYCVLFFNDAPDRGYPNDSYFCDPTPAACMGVPSCECLADEDCGDDCSEIPGGIQVVCGPRAAQCDA